MTWAYVSGDPRVVGETHCLLIRRRARGDYALSGVKFHLRGIIYRGFILTSLCRQIFRMKTTSVHVRQAMSAS